jgi:hypothetical protein
MNRRELIGEELAHVSFPGWRFYLRGTSRLYIQGYFWAPNSETGETKLMSTRKWYVSIHATKNEIVQTCLKCVLAATEHEARENFKYKGHAIYGPHFDPDALVELCVNGRLDVREEGH